MKFLVGILFGFLGVEKNRFLLASECGRIGKIGGIKNTKSLNQKTDILKKFPVNRKKSLG